MSRNRAQTGAIDEEVASQPATWRQAAGLAGTAEFPSPGQSVALIGCGTSLFVSQAVARWREEAGHGVSDAFTPSELPLQRSYDAYVVISRSGTTTEVLQVLDALDGRETYALTATPDTPVAQAARHNTSLPFADESAVVQTRFATSAIALWRAYLGHDVERLAAEAERKLEAPLPDGLGEWQQLVFLGHGASVGLANEAALKFREAALAWTESYPGLELRHGPISLLGNRSLVWSLGPLPEGLDEEIVATGARLQRADADGLAELVLVHRTAVALSRAKGLDPDSPPRLQRSVMLSGSGPGVPDRHVG